MAKGFKFMCDIGSKVLKEIDLVMVIMDFRDRKTITPVVNSTSFILK